MDISLGVVSTTAAVPSSAAATNRLVAVLQRDALARLRAVIARQC